MIRRGLAGALLACFAAQAADLDLSKARLALPAELSKRESKAVEMLRDEVQKRTQIQLPIAPSAGGPAIAISRGRGPAEGYSLQVAGSQLSIIADDERGLLFGIGRLLREMHMRPGQISIAGDLNITTSPKYPLRGHQLGYRPKTNSYDGWSVPVWEQYIRDLAVFGTNAVELIPPRSDDAADSPLFPLPPMQMMIEMSRLLDEYGLDVWIWYPAMDPDYSDPQDGRVRAQRNGAKCSRNCPRIDAVFVPGGDPGHTEPKVLDGAS